MITIKSPREIELMRSAGKALSQVHYDAKKALQPGMTTWQLDQIIHQSIKDQGAIASFYGYHGFPAASCISINEEVIHGIPGPRVIQEGDVVSIDIGLILNGYHSDAARTHIVGEVSQDIKELVSRTQEAFYEGLKYCRQGYRFGDVSHAIETYINQFGYGIIREYTGHGIGTSLHEDPAIPNYGRAGKGPRIMAGMTVAIEPMVALGSEKITVLDDDWTVVCSDGKVASHYEQTILITEDEPEILTNKVEVCYHG